jgi:copper(I)-binding protein/cytochrome oxidase Cu insertion factor (SCO1/SenC/PrrC family)
MSCTRLLALAVIVASITGCAGSAGRERLQGQQPAGTGDVSAVTLPEVRPGQPDASFAFRAEPGHLLFVYFGYASCPDICPMTMSDFRKALQRLGPDAARVQLAFVTVDPARDSAQSLVPFVTSFVPSGHALVPRTQEQLGRAEAAFGATSSVSKSDSGAYEVSHTGLAYIVDDRGRIRVQWDFGTKPDVMAHDLRILLATSPATATAPAPAAAADGAPAARVAVTGAWVRASPPMARAGAMYATLTSGTRDRLIEVDVPAATAARAEIHAIVRDDAGRIGMRRSDGIELPAGRPVELAPGTFHVMLMELARPLVAGDSIDATLKFERAASERVRVPVRAG